jgi:hypothetical protein
MKNKIIALGLVGFAAMCGLAVIVRVGSVPNVRSFPQVGRSVDIGGRHLNIYCSGSGSPAIVFETFSHQAGLSWMPVQSGVAAVSQTCWYDRAGYGWSDPGPLPRTFRATASDLHALLRAAAVSPPYLLVGSHDAVSVIRVFTGLYPADVAGAVFIDGNDLAVYAHLIEVPPFLQGPVEQRFGRFSPLARRALCFVLPVARSLRTTLPRTGPYRRTPAYGFPPERQAELDFLSDRSTGEACDVRLNIADVEAAGDFGSRPLIVLGSAEQHEAGGEHAEDMRAWNDSWVSTVQPSLADLSTRGRLIIERHVDRDAIVRAIRDAIDAIRSRRPAI